MTYKNYLTTTKVLCLLAFVLQGYEIETKILNIALPENLEPRIINGTEVKWDGTRYQVSIRLEQLDRYFFGSGHLCGGSIIARNIILTAAHCIWNENINKFRTANEFSIVMGNLDRSLKNENTLKLSVSKIITGQNFNPKTFKDDLAIMFLKEEIPESYKKAEVIKLNENLNIPNGKQCFVTGWGLTETGIYTKKLQSVEVPILNRKTCSLNYGTETILDGMLCAGYMKGERDACSGDSGGPLVCDNKLVGIVSFGLGCALPGYPGVYTDVAYYYNWLINHTALTSKLIANYTLNSNTSSTINYNSTMDNPASTISSSSQFMIIFLILFNVINYKLLL